jgi:hypothetical protein
MVGLTMIRISPWHASHVTLHKGTNLSGIDSITGKVVRLFDPRRQKWSRHFHWQSALLVGKTLTGRATLQVLQINQPIRIALRESLIEIGEFAPDEN